MSTSLLYHAWGLSGYHQQSISFEKGKVIFKIKHNPDKVRCASCGSYDVICRGKNERLFRTVPIGMKRVFLELGVQRVECRECGAVRQVDLGFAEPRFFYTKLFERYVLDLSNRMTMSDIARHLEIGWDVIKEIQKRHLNKYFSKPKLRYLRFLGIDEISIGKRHKYLTIVLDLESGAVVFVGDGKGADALKPFWKRLKQSRAQIEAVAMDMSPAYRQAVEDNLPDAAIIYDHFHIIKLFNEKLSDLRRDLQREAQGRQKEVLKGTRWLLLKNPDNLDDSHKEKERLQEALELNRPLAIAYYLKEDLRLNFWAQLNKAAAEQFLDDWIAQANESGVEMLKKFAQTLDSHRSGLLAYYHFPISTGPLEGTNTKIRVIQRKAYGFRDKEFFKLKIMALHKTKQVLVGGV